MKISSALMETRCVARCIDMHADGDADMVALIGVVLSRNIV